MPKKIALVFPKTKRSITADPYWNFKPRYQEGYFDLVRIAKNLDAELFFVRDDKNSYRGNGKWIHSWQIDNDGSFSYAGEIRVDVLWIRGPKFRLNDGKVPFMNHPRLIRSSRDKWQTYKLFPDISPQTFLANNLKELRNYLLEISGSIKVTKPIHGSCGKDIFIGNDDFLLKQKHNWPILVQSFLDTSVGMKGVFTGIHDLRLGILNGEIVFSFVHLAAKDSYLANISQGASVLDIPLDSLPSSVRDLVLKIDREFTDFRYRYYSIDLAFVSNQPWLIELNSSPSIIPDSQGKIYQEFKRKLIKSLINFSNKTSYSLKK